MINPVNNHGIYTYNTIKSKKEIEGTPAVMGDDSLEISSDAIIASGLLAKVKSEMPLEQNLDFAKVLEIKQKIQDGTYDVSSKEVANKFISF